MRIENDWFKSPASASYARRTADEYDSAVSRGDAEGGTRQGWWDFLDWKSNNDGWEGVEKELLAAGCDPLDVNHDATILAIVLVQDLP